MNEAEILETIQNILDALSSMGEMISLVVTTNEALKKRVEILEKEKWKLK